MKRLSILFALLVLAVPASAQSPPTRTDKVLYGASVAGAVGTGIWDGVTTHRNIELGFQEGNPILRRSDGTTSYARKAGIVAGIMVANHFGVWRRGARKWAVVVNVGLCVYQGVAARHNTHLRLTYNPDGTPVLIEPAAKFTVRW